MVVCWQQKNWKKNITKKFYLICKIKKPKPEWASYCSKYVCFIFCLFSAPIHVVELTNVPPELRMNSAAPGHSRMSSSEGGGHGSESDSKLVGSLNINCKTRYSLY